MSEILGVGVDLTQHVPLVAKALCPVGAVFNGHVDATALARQWPPPIKLCNGFCSQPPVCVLPLMDGEPPLVGDAAARHRRGAGLSWPLEAQVPYGGEEEAGIGRIPLLAAWASLVPPPGTEDSIAWRADPEFGWQPEGRNLTVSAGQMIALSLRAFLQDAGIATDACRVAVVVPDALDESGQQILLDACWQVGLAPDNIHLLPRPLAIALHWCSAAKKPAVPANARGNEEGLRVGRLRVLSTSMDAWEALSLEIRARRHAGRIWLVPLRDRIAVGEAKPELDVFGVGVAATLALQPGDSSMTRWWARLFASTWLSKTLSSTSQISQEQVAGFRAVLMGRLPNSIRENFHALAKHHTVWSHFGRAGHGLHRIEDGLWEQQEQLLDTTSLPLLGILACGGFSRLLRFYEGRHFLHRGTSSDESALELAPVRGAALAAAAIAQGLPCYREKILPLDLCVRATDEYGDPTLQWKSLAPATSVEAGGIWRAPEPITGLKIEQGQNRLILPLRRSIKGRNAFRQVTTELTQPAAREEPVRVHVEAKPGQGFARVRIDSVTPGVFSARLDWRTMEECDEPKPPPLAYIPGVSRIEPDRVMFEQAEGLMVDTLRALEERSPTANECLRELIRRLNRWPLAHNVERRRGRIVVKDFRRHYGVIGSDGKLEDLPKPDLVRRLRDVIGERFEELWHAGRHRDELGQSLLRAGGWFYLAMPEPCYRYLRMKIRDAERSQVDLNAVDLHAIGLAFETVEDLRPFYPLVVQALHSNPRPNNWLRAVRNICRFRNHALRPEAISLDTLYALVGLITKRLREQIQNWNFEKILSNCLETIPFLLKRRRYDPTFLPPDKKPAVGIIELLDNLRTKHHQRLPRRLQHVPMATINFLRRQATDSDLEALLAVEDEEANE